MPSLGADMEHGTLVEWRVRPGDQVQRGDIVAVIDTDKAAIEVETFVAGIVEELLVVPGAEVPVGTPLARIRTEGEPATPTAAPTPPEAPAPPARPAPAAAPSAPAPTAPAAPPTLRASPYARQLARELGVDLAAVSGSGPRGAIQEADIRRAAAAIAPRPAPAGGQPPPTPAVEVAATADARRVSMRRAIAAALARSNREIPHYYLAEPIDLEPALTWLEAANAARPVRERVLPAALLLRAVALAAREVPELNGFWRDDAFVAGPGVHVGVAIALPGGLIAPAIHDADASSLVELMRALADLVERARTNRLRGSELTDATITVTNLGDQGVESVFGVIQPPQVALVGFGRIRDQPWVHDGRVVARRQVTATLSADHRATDGHTGARFLAAIARLLQQPERL